MKGIYLDIMNKTLSAYTYEHIREYIDEVKRDGEITGPYQPMVYDIATRNLLGLSLFLGYNGRYADQIEDMMEKSDDITLKMQSVTGELAFGGRSNQCIHNEMMMSNYFELRATLLSQKGEAEKAAEFKAAAIKAAKTTADTGYLT